MEPLTSKYFDSVISKDNSIIYNSLYELKSIAKVDELTIIHRSLETEDEMKKLDELMDLLLDIGDFVQVLRILELFGRATEDLKLFRNQKLPVHFYEYSFQWFQRLKQDFEATTIAHLTDEVVSELIFFTILDSHSRIYHRLPYSPLSAKFTQNSQISQISFCYIVFDSSSLSLFLLLTQFLKC